jgi:hypothetical protein
MLDRRQFLTASAVGGVTLAGSSVLGVGSALARGATRWSVGQTAPSVSGYDQYDGRTKLRRLSGSWALLDVCAGWCEFCQQTASSLPAFIASINEQGVPLKLLTVMSQNFEGGSPSPSDQRDAERWATIFGYEGRGSVLHCGGSAGSPLYPLVYKIAEANGNSSAGFPCYVLIDPTGVVRYF